MIKNFDAIFKTIIPSEQSYKIMRHNLCLLTIVVNNRRISVKRYNGPPLVKNKFEEIENGYNILLLLARIPWTII